MRNKFFKSFSLIIGLSFFPLLIKSQASGVGVNIIVNGGIFEFSPPYVDYVTLNLRHTYYGDLGIADTIYTQSAQDILVYNEVIYVAAADSIIMYEYDFSSLNFLKRRQSTAFGAPSTIKMLIYKDFLIVGNWYGSSDNNLRIFDNNTLNLVDSIPEIKFGAKDFIIYKDSLFIQQNLTSSNFEDSAGFISVVDLKNMKYVRDISLNNNNQDLGRLFVKGDSIVSINSVSNTITNYNITNGVSNFSVLPGNIEVGPYGQQFAINKHHLYLKIDGAIKDFNLNNYTLDTNSIVDSVTSFILDTIQEVFITTKTDFGSYSYGSDHNLNGTKLSDFKVGYSPEVIGGIYGVWEGYSEINPLPIKAYPNPFNNYINLELANSKGNLEIYNLQGALVYSKTGVSGKVQIQLEDLPAGMYRAVFNNKREVYSSKIVKTK